MSTIAYSIQSISGPDIVNTTKIGSQQNFHTAKLLNGNTAVAYDSYVDGVEAVYVRLLNASGDPFGNQLTIETNATAYGSPVDITRLNNGNIVVAWIKDGDVFARIYTPNLQPVTGIIPIDDSPGPANPFYEPRVTATPDGGFVVGASYIFGNGDNDIHLKTYNANGGHLHDAYIQPSSTGEFLDEIAVAPNGNILVSYASGTTQNGFDPFISMFNSDLGLIRDRAALTGEGTGDIAGGQIAARADSTFDIFLNYYNYAPVTPEGHVLYHYNIDRSGVIYNGSDPLYNSEGRSPQPYDVKLAPDGRYMAVVGISSDSGSDYRFYFNTPTGPTEFTLVAPDNAGPAEIVWANSYTFDLVHRTSYGEAGYDGDGYGIAVNRMVIVATQTGNGTAETFNGTQYLDVMLGNGGNDTLNGGSGADTMRGGAGSDTYYVDNGRDVVDEQAALSDGYDTVRSSINYTLGNNVEALALLGTAYSGTGNALDNYLQGNAAANRLDGSYGADNMVGLGGNDVYVVDNPDDVVNEINPGSGGFDTVYSLIDYKLGTNLEGLVLVGTLKLDGTGNSAANSIQGNSNTNVLKGGGGNDSISGAGGKDKIDGGGGSDTAYYNDKTQGVSVTLNGSQLVTVKVGNNAEDKIKNIENLLGSSKADHFTGDSQANSFDGGLGKDVFKGGGGNDRFVFSTALVAANADTIVDFQHKHDTLVLSRGLVNAFLGSEVEKAEFYAKDGAHKAHDNDDRLIYDKSNGHLYLDVDGKDGAAVAVLIAKLDNHPGNFNFHDIDIV